MKEKACQAVRLLTCVYLGLFAGNYIANIVK